MYAYRLVEAKSHILQTFDKRIALTISKQSF